MQSNGLAGLAAMLTIAAQVAACAVGPDYVRPTLETSDHFIRARSVELASYSAANGVR